MRGVWTDNLERLKPKDHTLKASSRQRKGHRSPTCSTQLEVFVDVSAARLPHNRSNTIHMTILLKRISGFYYKHDTQLFVQLTGLLTR
jgi:hypothetical protein